ncbi:MAG: DUF1735 domain-containing protein [Sphingobacteriales bacterium]|nr:DUF1735 domain-containing protein [Sphingobacteriales bacterium]
MKYIILILAILASCNKKAIDVEDLSRFHKIYIVQAGQNPFANLLKITDSLQIIQINAGIGGLTPASQDMAIHFEVLDDSVAAYNAANLTNYQVVPQASFQFSTADVSIKKGDYFSSPLEIQFKTLGYIEGGVSYLLPIGISKTGNGVPVNDQHDIVYLLITGSYPLGKEPPKQVFDLSGKSLISAFPYQNAFIMVETNGTFSTHEWDATNNVYKTADVFPNGGWNIFDKVLGSSTKIITRWAGSGNLWEYPFDVSKRNMAFDGVTRGTNFNNYDIISYSQQFDALLCRAPAGELSLIKRSAAAWDQKTILGTDFASYTMIEAYLNGFLCVDAGGELYFYPINNDLTLGAKAHAGSGWSKYKSIMSRGNQLLALDYGGVLWQYNFDLAGFWDIR